METKCVKIVPPPLKWNFCLICLVVEFFLANFQFEFKFNFRFLGGWLKLFIVPPCLESNTLPFVFLYILRGTSPVIFLLG